MLVANGRISLQAFCSACSVLPVAIISYKIYPEVFPYFVTVYLLLVGGVLRLRYKGPAFQVAIRACLLGTGFAIGILVASLADRSWIVFGWYLCCLTFFHYSEYFTTSVVNPKALCLDSFLINHSVEYGLAALCCLIEFVIERWLFPEMKMSRLSYIGLSLCIAGEVLRKVAMFTAKTNFNHLIQIQREEGHVLITHGIYGLCRHPSYVGWFLWSIGTQILVCNPICFVGYLLASWSFFKLRVYEEEITLLNFFGEDYVRYQRRVPTGLPFIYGYRVTL
ncbi:hypothetical protein CHUAL_000311 [Chamberlinius hualienensis]